MVFRSKSVRRRLMTYAIPVMALVASGCKGMRDKIDRKLYAAPDGSGWIRDSTFLNSSPPVLFRVIHKGPNQYITPIGLLSKAPPQPLRLVTKRGWSMFDINFLYQGREVTPVQDGFGGAPVKMQRGMWEIPSSPLDTMAMCQGSLLPLGLVSVPNGTELVVANYKLPTGMKLLSPGEIQEAIREVPLLVTPTMQVTAAQLTQYSRTIHQIPRVGAEPAILLEYHNDSPETDTSVVGKRRPRHLIIVLEKGVYTYRPSWVYKTTGGPTDLPILRYLEIMDADMDGRSELFFYVDVTPTVRWFLAFRQWNDTWKEYWRRSPYRCDN